MNIGRIIQSHFGVIADLVTIFFEKKKKKLFISDVKITYLKYFEISKWHFEV